MTSGINRSPTSLLLRLVPFAVGGTLVAGFIFWMGHPSNWWKWIIFGALCGLVVGWFWPLCHSIVIRLRIEDWHLNQIEIQGLKFTCTGTQRRVAWLLFIEAATRIAAQPLRPDEGNDGAALKSLFELFQVARKALATMEPTPHTYGDTVETYALDMLNSDLRPFLSKWHPRWEEFEKTGNASTQAWPLHAEFRKDLRDIQTRVEARARGLAQLAGMKNVDRFFPRA